MFKQRIASVGEGLAIIYILSSIESEYGMTNYLYSVELITGSDKIFTDDFNVSILDCIAQRISDIEIFILSNSWYGLEGSDKILLTPIKINDYEWVFDDYEECYATIKILHKIIDYRIISTNN